MAIMCSSLFRALLFCSLSLSYQTGLSQTSHQGVWLPAKGELNVLVVYAEAVNDPTYNSYVHEDWPPGELPRYPAKYFDSIGSVTAEGYVSGFFSEASHGALKMNGIYWPQLIQVDFNAAAYSNLTAITKALNEGLSNANSLVDDIIELDRWTPKPGFQPKLNQPDSLIDAVVVIWRVNSKISKMNNTGYCASHNQYPNAIGFKGINCFSEFQSWENHAINTLRHELSHAIYGGNNFHNGGAGAGTRTFIQSVGGYSMLSSFDSYSNGFSGWDRERVGWKNPRKKYVTSAYRITAKGLVEHSFEQPQKQTFANGKYLIRNFLSIGDAMCLRLPGPDSPRFNQYLWLEYHADTSQYDFPATARHGVYAYVQAGKDDKKNTYGNSTASPGNYTFALPASGRWDFEYYQDSTLGKAVLKKSYDKPNPIVGDHFLMRPMIDANKDGVLEKLFIPEVLIDGNARPQERYLLFGNADDPFKSTTQQRINVSTNPSTNTLITHNAPHHRKTTYDSDTSFITGLDIRMRDTTSNFNSVTEHCVLLDVKWNRFNITNSVRWCGNIALKPLNGNKPKLTVDSGCVLLLDRSLTPMHEKINKNDTLNGQLYFSPLTTFTLYKGTQLVLKKGATLKLANNSTLYVRKGADVIFEDGAKLESNGGWIMYLD